MEHHGDLLQKVESLAETLLTLSDRLIQVVQELRDPGIPPSEEMIEQQLAARKTFRHVRDVVLEYTKSMGVLPTPEADSITTTQNLKALLQAAEEAEAKRRATEEVRQHALAIVNKILRIVHRDTSEFPALRQCYAHAYELRNVIAAAPWTETPSEVQALAKGTHPLSVLLMFVERFEELDDEQWEVFHTTIAASFEQALVTAVLRQRLILQVDLPIQASTIPAAPLEEYADCVCPTSPTSGDETTIPLGTLAQEGTAEEHETPLTKTEDIQKSDEHTSQNALTEAFLDVAEASIHETKAADIHQALENELLSLASPRQGTLHDYANLSNATVPQTEVPPTIQVETEEEGPAVGQSPFCFGPTDTAQYIATSILSSSIPDRAVALRDLVWRLIYEDKLALAFHTARYMDISYPDLQPVLPPWLVHALALGRQMCHATGTMAHLLKHDFMQFDEVIFVPRHHEWNHAIRFLLAAAALRPALLAPNTDAARLLHTLRMKEGLNALWEYCEEIADYGKQQMPLDPNALKKAKDQAVWQTEMESLCQQVNTWCTQAPSMTMVYAPATKVWRYWQETGGLIHSLLLPVRQNDLSRVGEVKQQIDKLSDDAEIKSQIAYTDRKVLKRRLGDDITAKARGQLCAHVREAVEFARHWVGLYDTSLAHNQSKTYGQQRAEQIRQKVLSRQEAVLEELECFAQQPPSLCMMSSITACRRVVEDIGRLFDPNATFLYEEPLVPHLLQADFLRIPGLMLNEGWEPESCESAAILDAILQLIATDHCSWPQVLEEQSKVRNHEATALIIEYLEAHPVDGISLDTLRTSRAKHLDDCHAALQRDIETTRQEVNIALTFGWLRESEFRDDDSTLENMLLALKETVRFVEKHESLHSMRHTLDQKRAAYVATAWTRIQTEQISSEHPAYDRICRVLEIGDVSTANEYIDMVPHGLPLPEEQVLTSTFEEFFPEGCEKITDFLEPPYPPRPDPLKIVSGIREYAKGRRRTYELGPIDMGSVAGQQAAQAADMLEAWFQVKKMRKIDRAAAQTILMHLGFNPLEITIHQAGRHHWINVVTEPLQDPTRCPVHAYGSSAHGRYRILCVWDRPTEEDLVNDVGDTSRGTPALVFYFGRVTEQKRRDLARVCRERRRTILVIDDVVILYLCGERGPRLPVLFECTLPFTFLEPYTTTAGLVPPEMFYGRVIEREAIIAPMGSCFIYGGRQLGKTALLRDIERSFHALSEGRIALWIDLKTRGIGIDRPIDEIWQILIVEFKKLGVLPASLPDHTGPDRLFARIQEWLDKDERRRILLLLDEADRFLISDGKEEFGRAARIKGLMDSTNRRFKVVFAGLHNVQRTTKQENHPLAHYGDPLCIGPLLANGEWREARALVERPLASLGFRFESPDLVTRILSQTNYYPNLIQLYCTQLLRHMTNPNSTTYDPKTCPPYMITSRHVDEAYQSQELRAQIRDRFMLTLQLDQRYEVIAYAMSYRYCLDSEHSLIDGFSISQVRQDVMNWWPEGFHTSASEDAIRALLDEMVGLGILRSVGVGNYTLRSPNVVSLMGTEEEISRVLESSREAPIEYEPASFRTAFRTAQFRRSPLTAQQESELRSHQNGVSIIFGCRAAGLDELEDFLTLAFGKEFLITYNHVTDKADFIKQLSSDLSNREKDGVTLVLVLPTCPWSEYWVSEAVEKVHAFKSRSKFVRIVFVADPQLTWQLLSPGTPILDTLIKQGVTTFSLQTWHDVALRQWLVDCGVGGPSDQGGRNQIATVTGNWPFLLGSFYQRCKADPHRWERSLQELDEALKGPFGHEVANTFGLHRPEVQRVLHDLMELGEASLEDRVTVME